MNDSKITRLARRIASSPWLDRGALPAVWILLTIFNLIPVWHQRMLPMLDTPNHLALIRGWHSFSDPAYHITDYYVERIKLVPYIFFYTSVHLLMYLVSIETANKIFLSFYLILFPLSVLAVARALKRSPWLALGAFPLSYNPGWIYGYSSLLIGNCFGFLALASLIKYLTRKRERDLLILLLCSTLVYFSHILPWFILGLTAICYLVLHRKETLTCLRASAAMLPSVILALVAMVEERWEHAYIHEGKAFSYQWRDVPTLLEELPRRILEIFPGSRDMWVLAVVVATTAGLCIWRGVKPEHGPGETRHLKVYLALMALLYLCLPYQITGPLIFFQMAQRVPVVAASMALLLPSGAIVGRQRLLFVPLIVASLLLPMRMATLYRDFSRRNADFMAIVDEVPLGTSALVVFRGMWANINGPVAESSGDPATSGPVYWHFSSWPMALRGGYSPYLFDQGIPIRYSKRLAAPEWSTMDYFELRHAPKFDYYLANSPTDQLQNDPHLRMVNQIGEWWLFQRIATITEEP